jgi:hypothetical protein
MVLETTFETATGTATLVDFMPLSDDPEEVDVIRIVRGVSGRVAMRMELAFRSDTAERFRGCAAATMAFTSWPDLMQSSS